MIKKLLLASFGLACLTAASGQQTGNAPAPNDNTAMQPSAGTAGKEEAVARFPGGIEAWKKYLSTHMDAQAPILKGAPAGEYVVEVEFTIDTNGAAQAVKALTYNGYGMEQEAVRLVFESPRWEPARKNGRAVRTTCRQPLTFVVTGNKGAAAIFGTPAGAVDTLQSLVDEEGRIFERVDEEASFKGGQSKWASFLMANLDGMVPVRKGAPAGSYTVLVQFIVNKKGMVSDIRTLTNHGYGMEQEVMRIMKKSPRWDPAVIGQRTVNAYRKQPVTFMVVDERKKR